MTFRKQLILLFVTAAADLALFVCLAFAVFSPAAPDGRAMSDGLAVSADEAPGAEPGAVVALTFDDGPDKEYTAKLLDGLKERGVHASFFLIGNSIEGNEDLVRRMAEEGHLVGVHCLYHTELTKESISDAVSQLGETKSRIAAVTGTEPEYMRPPYGAWNDALEEAVGMTPVFWSVDSLDWKVQDAGRVVENVLRKTESGDIILMHDGFSTSVEAALRIIDNLLLRGYTFVTVDELMVD